MRMRTMNRSSCDSGSGKVPGEVLRVLRREDEERIGQRDGLPVERDLPFVHRFEQRRLGARARAVDFVGEQDVREDGPLAEDELAAALVVDRDAEHVAREQIARELHASKLAADRLGDRARERGLADPGHVLDEHVAAREQRDSASSTASGFPSRACSTALRRRAMAGGGSRAMATAEVIATILARVVWRSASAHCGPSPAPPAPRGGRAA